MTTKAKCERIDVVKNVRGEVFQGLYQSVVRTADSVFGVKRKGKASKFDDGGRPTLGTLGLWTDDENFITAAFQLSNEVERTVDHSINLRQKHLSDDRNSHVGSPNRRSV